MSSTNVSYFINGFEACSDYNLACFIADSLSQVLSNFSVRIATKKSSDWKNWLEQTCKLHNWTHDESPLIWRENDSGGKAVYIGGIQEFKSWLKKNYKIDATLPSLEQEALNLDYALAQNIELKQITKDEKSKNLNITISGASASLCSDLIVHLAKIGDSHYNRLVIKLYDEAGCCCETINNVENSSDTDFQRVLAVDIIENLSDSLENCEILIILNHLARETDESTASWLSRNYEAIKNVAAEIDKSDAAPYMKVIFCSMGPDCFCANALIQSTNKLNKKNVVAVSAHYGLKMASKYVDMLRINEEEIGCPPIWGFLGVSHYIDIHHTIQKGLVYIPNKRALTFDRHSTLPLGIQFLELRWLQYMTFKEKFNKTLHDCKELQVNQEEDSLRCRALCNLLELWHRKDQSKIEDEVVSLGIISDGTFNIPKGMFFSQPVQLKILDDNSLMWVPCSAFPTPSDSDALMNMIATAKSILQNMEISIE